MGEKFDRLLEILNILDQKAPCSTPALAAEWGVAERTVFRYFSSLQYAGFPIYYDRVARSYRFADGFSLKKAHLDADETLILALSKTVLGIQGPSVEKAFEKVEQRILGISEKKENRALAALVPNYQQQPACRDLAPLIKDVISSCNEQRLMRITYHSLSSQSLSDREIEPHYLFYSTHGYWNVRSYCRLREEWRTFALDRIRNYRLLDRYFAPKIPPAEFLNEVARGFGAYLGGDKVRVILRFSPAIRPYVERKMWHPSQETIDLPDGWLELRLEAPGIKAIKPWLYRWIPHVKIVEPEGLKKEMITDLKIQRENLE